MGAWKNGLIVAALAAFGIAGCQSKMAQENRGLWQQNRELQAQNTELANRPKADPSEVAQLQSQLAQRDQQLAAYQQQAKPPASPALDVAPAGETAPHARGQIAGLETTFDKASGDMTVTVPGDVLFDPGSATLKASSKATLNRVASALKSQYGGKHIFVDGYSDTDPIAHTKSLWRDNLDLSAARARAVARYLQTQGVQAQNLEIRAFGPAHPKATKDASRRVELVVATR